ncbi:CHAT domain-containing protein [Mycena crocata]|nr:CHAT domain-containing protein [Mycena crocata]
MDSDFSTVNVDSPGNPDAASRSMHINFDASDSEFQQVNIRHLDHRETEPEDRASETVTAAQRHPEKPDLLNKLFRLLSSAQEQGTLKNIDDVVKLHRMTVAIWEPANPNYGGILDNLTTALRTRFNQQSDQQDINETIEIYRAVLTLHASASPNHESSLTKLGIAIIMRFEPNKDPQDIDRAIELRRDALALYPHPHPSRAVFLNNLAYAILTRFQRHGLNGNPDDMDTVIQLYREVLALCPPPHPKHGSSLDTLAHAIHQRVEQRGGPKDINENIQLWTEAVALRPAPHLDYGTSLDNLAHAIYHRFLYCKDLKDLDRVIELHKQALDLFPHPHPARNMCLIHLATAIHARFEERNDPRDLDDGIALHRQALLLNPEPGPYHDVSLINLAEAIRTRFGQHGNKQDIDETIKLLNEALVLHAGTHPTRWLSLSNLAEAFRTRFEQFGDAHDIDEAIKLQRDAVSLHSESHPSRGSSLIRLGVTVQTRYTLRGDPKDIEEAIKLQREGLDLHPGTHPTRGWSLMHLATAIQIRFKESGDLQDIDESVKLLRQALALHPAAHYAHGLYLINLAVALYIRFKECGDLHDIDESIHLFREALQLYTGSHPRRALSLLNLAEAIRTRFWKCRDSKDIEEAIKLQREALSLHTGSHPTRGVALSNLAEAIHMIHTPSDIDQSIELHHEALAVHKPPHVNRGLSLGSLAAVLVCRFVQRRDSSDIEMAFALWKEGSTYTSSSPLARFKQTQTWAIHADKHNHVSSLTAYHTAIGLLPQLAALHLSLPSRRKRLSAADMKTLATDACSHAVGLKQYNRAFEFLEAGRSIFWSQALQLRRPLDDLTSIRPELSCRIRELASQLERASFRGISDNLTTDTDSHKILSMEAEGARCRDLSKQWDETIKSVQMIPGFEDFMKPKSIVKLQKAAEQGTIVVLHCGKVASNALVMKPTGIVECVPLPDLPLHVVQRLSDSLHALATSSATSVNIDDLLRNYPRNLSHNEEQIFLSRLVGGREGPVDANDMLGVILKHLWNWMVVPIFDVLQLKKTSNPPRLWWCPTGPFAFLPIHAAGVYEETNTSCVMDYIISSYTQTITALLDPPTKVATSFKMTMVIEPDAPDCDPLPGAEQELKNIAKRVPNQMLTVIGDKEQATVETALLHLRGSSILHFACHGTQNLQQPLDSGLILRDGSLKVSDIMRRSENSAQLDLRSHMALAFLGACETAKGDTIVPDEAMHLAATLQFAGFRGVVATLWTIIDSDGPKIADKFYEYLFRNCDPNSHPPILPDLTRAAEALHFAIVELRKEPDIPFHRWVPFIHYGL